MGSYPALPSEKAAVVGVIDPDAYTADSYSTGWIDMKLFGALMATVMAGTLGTSATIDAKFEQATSAAGANPKDVTGTAITQLTQAGTDSDKQAVINLRESDLDVDNGYRFARLTVTVGTATSDMGALVQGFFSDQEPASDNDASTVDEIVTV